MLNKFIQEFPDIDVDIKEAQKVQLEILLEFDRDCKKNNIKYQLFAGTLLGAIRHNGFIPWDDDIDVCMLREEYDKFLKIGIKELSTKYFLQNYKTDKNFYSQFSKIRKNDTLYVEGMTSDINMHHGIYIDVFPYDNVYPNTILGNIQRKFLYGLMRINYCRMKKRNFSASNKIIKSIRMILYYFLKLFPKVYMDKFITNIMCMFNNSDAKYVGELSLSTEKSLYNRFTLKKEVFYESIDWEFEGYRFPIPRDYDEVLTANYGDYMAFPPKEEQKPHHGIISINFDTTLSK